LVDEHDEQLIGFLIGTRGELKRNRHSFDTVVGILQAFTGRGIGTQLFVAMEQWARQRVITRLELTVMTHNQAGVALYKKQGFAIEGRKKHSLLVDGYYVDDYLMAKLLTFLGESFRFRQRLGRSSQQREEGQGEAS
jgi:RimJ/RimL family protein N-acetyltransferase